MNPHRFFTWKVTGNVHADGFCTISVRPKATQARLRIGVLEGPFVSSSSQRRRNYWTCWTEKTTERRSRRSVVTEELIEVYSHLPTVFPSASFAATKPPAGAPLRMGWMRMTTFAPGGNVDGR